MTLNIPPQNIGLIAHDPKNQNQPTVDSMFSSLRGQIKRDWFIRHAYFCLPLAIGNQHGFILKSLHDIEVLWNGGNEPQDLSIRYLNNPNDGELSAQSLKSHFGMGVITVQTTFSLRTPDGINLMTINPPNHYIDGIYHMTGVVETDNLRRDFTFNLKVTRPNHIINIKRGDIVGCFIPYPRHFIDEFKLVEASNILTQSQIEAERQCGIDFGKERAEKDQYKKNRNGRRYFNGEDVYGNKFADHQKTLG